MKGSTAEIERQARAILASVESGVELIDERARPFVERQGVTIVAAGLAALVGVGAAVIVLILLFFGFSRWNWFGAVPTTTAPPNQTTVQSPVQLPSGGGGGSPAASPSA